MSPSNGSRTGEVLGWIVLRRAEGRWWLDFDGELHLDTDVAAVALSQALEAGHMAILVEARWFRSSGDAA